MRRRRTLATQTGPASDDVGQGIPSNNTATAQWFAYLGAAPLIAAAMMVVRDGPFAGLAADFMGLYGAALIVFFGGVRWGVAVMKPDGPSPKALIGAAFPLVIALPLFSPMVLQWKFGLIMVLMIILLFDDLGASRRGTGAPTWYLSARLPLTMLIEVAFLVAFMGLA